jgi:hypothetical protein
LGLALRQQNGYGGGASGITDRLATILDPGLLISKLSPPLLAALTPRPSIAESYERHDACDALRMPNPKQQRMLANVSSITLHGQL